MNRIKINKKYSYFGFAYLIQELRFYSFYYTCVYLRPYYEPVSPCTIKCANRKKGWG